MSNIQEQKKSELDTMTEKVTKAQLTVNEFQAEVTALTQKVAIAAAQLTGAEAQRAYASKNKQAVDQLVQSALDLQANSEIARDQVITANKASTALAESVKVLMDELIYTTGMLEKLSNLVIRQKALNPLISDDLVGMIETAAKDANNAVALTLVALQSAFAAAASNIASTTAVELESNQSITFYQTLTGSGSEKKDEPSLRSYINKAYTTAKANYDEKEIANAQAAQQLGQVTSQLSSAQVKLQSLQAGLAAANAAVLV